MEPSADATALAAASKAEAEAGGADTKPGAESVPVLDPKVCALRRLVNSVITRHSVTLMMFTSSNNVIPGG